MRCVIMNDGQKYNEKYFHINRINERINKVEYIRFKHKTNGYQVAYPVNRIKFIMFGDFEGGDR